MELVIILTITIGIAAWFNLNRSYKYAFDVYTHTCMARFNKEEAQEIYDESVKIYLRSLVNHKLCPIPFDKEKRVMMLWLLNAAAAKDRLNQLNNEPHGYKQRKLIYKGLRKTLDIKASDFSDAIEMESARRG